MSAPAGRHRGAVSPISCIVTCHSGTHGTPPHRMRVRTVRFPVSFKRYFHTSQGWLQAKRRLNWLCRSASLPCRARLAPPCLHRFGPSPCPGHYPRHWANMASADSCLFTTQVALHGAGQIPALSAFLGFVSPLQAKALSWKSRDLWVPVAPAGNFTRKATSRMADRPPRIRT